MSLSYAGPGAKSTAPSFSWTQRSTGRLRSGIRTRLYMTPCRVFNAELFEIRQHKDTVDSDRALIELAYARTKVQEVHDLHQTAKQQLDELLALVSKPRFAKRRSRTIIHCPVVVQTKMKWEEEEEEEEDNQIFVSTTRETEFDKNRKRSDKALPEADFFSGDLMSPFPGENSSRLLTADEEKQLAVLIQKMLKIEQIREDFHVIEERRPSWKELAGIVEMDVTTLKKVVQQGCSAKQTMIERNMRLVTSIASKYRPDGADLHDLVVDGSIGLIRAIEKFDPTRGTKLSTYAHWWIRQGIIRGLADRKRVIRVPSNVSELFRKMIRLEKSYLEKHGHYPRKEELAEMLGLTMKRFLVIKNAYWPTVSFNKPLSYSRDNGITPEETIADRKIPSPEQSMANGMMQQDVDVVLSTLPEKEATVLRLRYGLEDGRERTLEDVGNLFHITRERVRQLETKALRKLRQRSGNLEEHLKPLPEPLYRTVSSAQLKAS